MTTVARAERPDALEETEHAIEVLGNRVRVAVLRSLLKVGTSTCGQPSVRLGISMALLEKHLAAREKLGAVSLDPPRTQPGVRPRTYSADRANVLAIAKALSKTFDLLQNPVRTADDAGLACSMSVKMEPCAGASLSTRKPLT